MRQYSLYEIYKIDGRIIVDKLDFTHYMISNARKQLMNDIMDISSKENAYEIQPTMNFKNAFHYFCGNITKYVVISAYYESENKSLLNRYKAIETLENIYSINL
jgi:hypothetical protein